MTQQIEIQCDVLLIGFTTDRPCGRMGLRLPAEHDLGKDFSHHHSLCQLPICVVKGCTRPTLLDSQHGWTCEKHAPSLYERIEKSDAKATPEA